VGIKSIGCLRWRLTFVSRRVAIIAAIALPASVAAKIERLAGSIIRQEIDTQKSAIVHVPAAFT